MFATSAEGSNPQRFPTHLTNNSGAPRESQAPNESTQPALPLRAEPTAEADAFGKVINKAQELAEAYLSIRGFRPGNQSGRATHTRQSLIVRPTASDFLADVTIAARPRSGDAVGSLPMLNAEDFAYFHSLYLERLLPIADPADSADWEDGEDKYFAAFLRQEIEPEQWESAMNRDCHVRNTVGARFLVLGLFPTEDYFAAVDVRRKYDQEQAFAGLKLPAQRKAATRAN